MLPLTAVVALLILEAMPVSAASSAQTLPKGAIVDLSHSYDAKTIFWPTESGFVLEPEHNGLTDKGYYYRSNKFSAPEHGGTHIDAPAHFAKDGNFVDAIPLDQLVGAAVVVDVTRKCQADRDYRIAIDDFREWEKAHSVPAMENLANLELLPPTGITVVALPMKIAGGSGGPLRAIAIVEER